MAYEGDLLTLTVANSGDLSGKQYMFVNYHGLLAGFQSATIGVVQNKPQAGEHATIGIMGVSKVRAGAVIAESKPFAVSSTGFAVAVASGAAVGRALTAATSGSVFTGLLFGAPGTVGSVHL
jgi:hypothetical protein